MLGIMLCMLSGCQFDSPPMIDVKNARWFAIGDSEPSHVQMVIDLELENRQEEPIQLEEFEYTFITRTAEGEKESWSGAWLALRTIPADSKIMIAIPAVVPAPADEIEWQVRGDLSYKAPGRWAQILFDTGLRRPSTGFSGSGTAPRPEDL